MANLDKLAAEHAQAIIRDTREKDKEDVENILTKALGVFQEQGLYAGMLYLLSRSNDSERFIATVARDQLVHLLNASDLAAFGLAYSGATNNPQALLDHFVNVTAAPVATVLLTKRLFEQTLTYARYGAKART